MEYTSGSDFYKNEKLFLLRNEILCITEIYTTSTNEKEKNCC